MPHHHPQPRSSDTWARQLSSVEKTLLYALDIVSDGIWDWNLTTGKVNRSIGWYRMLGYKDDCLPLTPEAWLEIVHPDDRKEVMSCLMTYMQGESPEYRAVYRCIRADGKHLWVQDRGRYVEFDADGQPLRMIGACTDVHTLYNAKEELKEKTHALARLNAELESLVEKRTQALRQSNKHLSNKINEITHLSQTDSLTGLSNRRHFEEIFYRELRRVRRNQSPVSLMIMDLDHFKDLNDTYGHQVGDEVLTAFSQSVKECLRDSDTFARWGGEEFIILMPESTLLHGRVLAERIRQQVNNTDYPHGVRVTASYGVSSYINGEQASEFFRRVDECMYLAKTRRDTIISSMTPNKHH